MKAADRKLLLVKLPSVTEQTLYLIKEELKSRKFFNTLRNTGLHDCHYQPSLDELILTNVGLHDNTIETYDFYHPLLEKHSKRYRV